MLLKNKKANLQDLILIVVLITFFAMVVLISFKVGSEFDDRVQMGSIGGVTMPDEAMSASSALVSFYPGTIDNVFLFLVVGLCISAIVLAAMVRVHPIFIPLFIIAWILVVFLSGILSNIYQTMAADTNLLAQANQLTFIGTIINFLPIFIGVFGIIIMVVLYKLGNPGIQ